MRSRVIGLTIAVIAAAVALRLFTGGAATPSGTSSAADSASGPYLFIDDALIAESSNLTRTIEPPRRLSDPAVSRSQHQNGQVLVPSMTYDRNLNVFRMWHWVRGDQGPGEVIHRTSADGVSWPGGGQSVFTFEGDSPVVLADGPPSEDPTRKYKLVYFRNTPRPIGMSVAFSADGLTWSPYEGNPVLPYYGTDDPRFVSSTGDIIDPFWDPVRGHYGSLVKRYTASDQELGRQGRQMPPGSGIRLTGATTSEDFMRWEEPWRVFVPDERDPGITEFYGAAVLPRGNQLVGFLRILRDDLPADPDGPIEGIGYTALATSHDGRTWSRMREPFLDRSATAGTFDHAMAWVYGVVQRGDDVFLAYSAYDEGHKIGKRQIGIATARRDRFVAMESLGDAVGSLRTRPIQVSGQPAANLSMNLDAHSGRVDVQVRDSSGSIVQGFSFEDCADVSLDSLDADVTCGRSFADLAGQSITLEVRLQRAKLFAISLPSRS